MSKVFLTILILLCPVSIVFGEAVDAETLKKWSAPYRGWHYHPEAVIPSDFKIPGFEAFHNFDVPCVYQLEDKPGVWYMSFIGFNRMGYNSFVVESADLINWSNPRQAMGFGEKGKFDHGGRVVGAYLYNDYDIKSPRTLKKKNGKYWTLFGAYPKQGGYELRPGSEGVAVSDDDITWQRVKDEAILSVHQPSCKAWEKDCIYQPWLVEHEGTYYNFYNAAEDKTEQLGLALSENLVDWVRYPLNPVVKVRPGGYDEVFASDAKVFRDGEHWTMIYFGVQKVEDHLTGHAHIMIAFSRDLIHWTADPEPLYKAGGHPTGLDERHAHKISLVHNPANDTFYMYYCAVGNKGRCIGLLTSKPLLPETDVEEKTDLPNVLILGDSISIGYTPYVREQLKGKANVYRPMRDAKRPINCGNTRMGLAGLDAWLKQYDVQWDVIHFNWGLWDINYRNPPNKDNKGERDKVNGGVSFMHEEYAENLEKIIAKLQKTGAKLVWGNISLVPEGESARRVGDDLAYNEVAAKIMKKHDIPINDINKLTRSMKPELMLKPGDVHYREDGYKIIAKQVANMIEQALATTASVDEQRDEKHAKE